MSEMTREHLEAVKDAAIEIAGLSDREANSADGNAADYFRHMSARLSEVAAMIEAKLESRDEG